MLRQLASGDRIDLARVPAFELGPLRVEPARLTVARGARSLPLEPRMMAVLVVLAEGDGRVVSRDELVERCWDGRIVADNAIQRVISRLRHVGAELDGFDVQAVTKVGYLLRPLQPDVAPAPHAPAAATQSPATAAPAPDRRLMIGALAALAAGGIGLLAWRPGRPHPDVTLARELVAKADEAILASAWEGNRQAIAYLKRATELDPDSAAAWSGLANAYAQQLEQSNDADLPPLAARARGAAERALRIDPGNARARIALATIPTNFQRWAANERALRALRAEIPPDSVLESALGWLLCDVGRWKDAIACFRSALALQPLHPGNQLILAWALWGGGELDEVERMLESGRRLWPNNGAIWQTWFDFLALNGRADAAVALAEDRSGHPVVAPGSDPPPYDLLRDLALAIRSRDPATMMAAADQLQARLHLIGSWPAVTYLGVLGAIDSAYALLEARFFGSTDVPAPGPHSRRKTSILFSAKGAPLRGDPRFPVLLERVGISTYWRYTGTMPDRHLLQAVGA